MPSAPGVSGRGSSGDDHRSSARAGLWEREHVDERMAAADLKHTLEQLVEAEKDQSEAARAMSDHEALLDFYLRRQEYYHALQQRQEAQRVAEDAYERTAHRLSRKLPQSSRLNYTYQRPREDLQGTTFAIENKPAKIVISSSASSGE